MAKELSRSEKDAVRRLEALPLKWDNAFGITPQAMVESRVASAFLRGEPVVMTGRPSVVGRPVGDAVMLSVSARDGRLDISPTSYERMLKELPVKWDEYRQFGVTPEAILATGRARDLVEGRDIRMEVDIMGQKTDKVLTLIRGGEGGPYINMDTPFDQKVRPRVWYGSGERDSYEIFEKTRDELKDGRVVLISPNKVSKDRPEVLVQLSPAGRLRYKRVDTLRESMKDTSLGQLLTAKQLDAYVHGEEVKPKGWKSAIHYSPVEGGFAYARQGRSEKTAEAVTVSQTAAQSEEKNRSRGRGI